MKEKQKFHIYSEDNKAEILYFSLHICWGGGGMMGRALIHNAVFGQTLRRFRKQRNMTQEVLALKCGLDRTYISLLELGSNSPTLDTMMLLCSALNLSSPSQFLIAVKVDPQCKKIAS